MTWKVACIEKVFWFVKIDLDSIAGALSGKKTSKLVVENQNLPITERLSVVTIQFQKISNCPMHTVSFDWFLFGLEWILNLEFC